MCKGFIPASGAILSLADPASAQDLPEALGDLLREATPSERTTIENVAKRLYADRRKEIDQIVDDVKKEEKARVASSRFIEGWTGELVLGANWSSGNTDEWKLSAATKLKRKGPQWEHRIDATIDIGNVDHQRTDERISAGYRVSYDLRDSAWFLVGSFRYDRDRFKDINRRFTEAAGLGLKLVDTPSLSFEVVAGPALRQTHYAEGREERQFAGFATTELEWDLSDTLTLQQDARLVFDAENTSLDATTALTKDLFGNFYARMSFTILAESNPPVGNEKVDTRSRASIVLDF